MTVRVGVVGLDTSHPEQFAGLLDERDDATVAAVWDGGDVRGEEHVESFCADHGADRYPNPESMVGAVDVAMVLTVNWDAHAALARPFLEAGVAAFVDKPVAGSAGDVADLAAAADAGDAPLVGGSALPFYPPLADLPRGVADRTLYAAGYDDPFYYGAHVVDPARAVSDADWTAVEPAPGPGAAVAVTFANGAGATLRFDGAGDDGTFAYLDVADRTRTVAAGSEEAIRRAYRGLVDAVVAAGRGDRDDRERVADAARLLLACQRALDGERATSGEEADVSMDGAAFLADYAPY